MLHKAEQPESVSGPGNRAAIVLVTGASRSGTTMLSRILGNHSSILGLKELHYFGDFCDPGRGDEQIGAGELERLSASLLARQARGIWGSGCANADYAQAKNICASLKAPERTGFGVFAATLSFLSRQAGNSIACEQTPRNVFYAERILAALPQVRVIHMVRDPRAVLASQKNRWQLKRLGAKNVPFTEVSRTWLNYHPITMAKLWAGATKSALRLADHPRAKLVRFEELVANPEEVVREICDFLGIAFESNMLLVPQWGSSNIQHQMEEKGISKDVVDRWEKILGDGEVSIVERYAGPLMKQFSYEARSAGGMPGKLSTGRYLLSYPFHLVGVALANPRRAWIQLSAMLQSNSTG